MGRGVAGTTATDVPAPLAPLFRPSVQPFLMAAFKHDPPKLLAAYPGPVLVVSGTTDVQVSVVDGDKLAAAKPGTRHALLKDMNHVLKEVKSTVQLAQMASYTDPKPPLHPKLTGELVGFFKTAFAAK